MSFSHLPTVFEITADWQFLLNQLPTLYKFQRSSNFLAEILNLAYHTVYQMYL